MIYMATGALVHPERGFLQAVSAGNATSAGGRWESDIVLVGKTLQTSFDGAELVKLIYSNSYVMCITLSIE